MFLGSVKRRTGGEAAAPLLTPPPHPPRPPPPPPLTSPTPRPPCFRAEPGLPSILPGQPDPSAPRQPGSMPQGIPGRPMPSCTAAAPSGGSGSKAGVCAGFQVSPTGVMGGTGDTACAETFTGFGRPEVEGAPCNVGLIVEACLGPSPSPGEDERTMRRGADQNAPHPSLGSWHGSQLTLKPHLPSPTTRPPNPMTHPHPQTRSPRPVCSHSCPPGPHREEAERQGARPGGARSRRHSGGHLGPPWALLLASALCSAPSRRLRARPPVGGVTWPDQGTNPREAPPRSSPPAYSTKAYSNSCS